MREEKQIIPDAWAFLKSFTAARIALGKIGVSLPIKEVLSFKMAHAHARDAVFSKMEIHHLHNGFSALGLPSVALQTKATDRHIYLQRPDYGRQLNEVSKQSLLSLSGNTCDVCICVADGLSAEAVNRHAIPIIALLQKEFSRKKIRIAPVCLVEGGRVAVGDEIGSILQVSLLLMLIGERPGLSSPHSMGAYLTYAPQVGLTDERRNCVSNIRPEGLKYEEAAEKIGYLVGEAFRLQLSGIALKDNAVAGLPASATLPYDGL